MAEKPHNTASFSINVRLYSLSIPLAEVLKITHNIYDEAVSPDLSFYARASTRGNNYKLVNHFFIMTYASNFFSARIVNIWNSLPNSVVDASTVNAFKAQLDKFWSHQAVKHDFTADLTGTGNRSKVLKSQSFYLVS